MMGDFSIKVFLTKSLFGLVFLLNVIVIGLNIHQALDLDPKALMFVVVNVMIAINAIKGIVK